jgi:heptosyltransferase-2
LYLARRSPYHIFVVLSSMDSDREPRSILIVLPTWVGDFVMATPFLRAVRERFVSARIAFLGEADLCDLASGCDLMDDWLEWPDKKSRAPWSRDFRAMIRGLRARRFDYAILLPNSFRSAAVARLAGAKRRIGYDRDGRGWLLTDRVPVKNREHGHFRPMPLVEYYADLAEHAGCRRPDDVLRLCTLPRDDEEVGSRLASLEIADRHPLVVLSPGARYGLAKLWLPERFAAVADRLIAEQGAAVVITCGPGEESLARSIASRMKFPSHVFDNPRLSLGELKSLIAMSDLMLCTDAGPRHIAKAFDVPVVTVFGPTHPEWTATSYANERIVRIDVDCGPCQRRVCPFGHHNCMTGVTVDAVYAACAELLSAGVDAP